MTMKWIFNQNTNELINTDTGAMFVIRKQDKNADCDAAVLFQGPIGGFWMNEEMDIYRQSILFEGTMAECEMFLDALVVRSNGSRLPDLNGTKRVVCSICRVDLTNDNMAVKTGDLLTCDGCYNRQTVSHLVDDIPF